MSAINGRSIAPVNSMGHLVTKTENVQTAGVNLFTVTGMVVVRMAIMRVTNASAVADYSWKMNGTGDDVFGAVDLSGYTLGEQAQMSAAGNLEAPGAKFSRAPSPISLVLGNPGESNIVQSVHTAGAAGDELHWTLLWEPVSTDGNLVAA